jgi:hypothetical protein
MNVVDPWTRMLEKLEPEYFTLKHILEIGPKVKAALRKVNLSWRVRIEEDWENTPDHEHNFYFITDYSNLDVRCEWADQQLATWKSATRLSHQEWKFSNQKDAEKFITLFSLRWTR